MLQFSFLPAKMTILIPQARDQNQPTSRKVTVDSCIPPTTQTVVDKLSAPFVLKRDLPQHRTVRPDSMVPEKRKMKMKKKKETIGRLVIWAILGSR